MDDTPGKAKRVVEMFEEGKRFTEEVMRENERLRLLVGNLKDEIRELGNQYVKVDVPRLKERVTLLEQENGSLREEMHEIKAQYSTIEKENWDFSERYLQVEAQNTSLLNLYVASQRLHSALELEEAIAIVKEIVINLIGSEAFDIYIVDHEARCLLPIASEGRHAPLVEPVPLEGVSARVVDSSAAFVAEAGAAPGTPVVCFPMRLSDRVIGVITIRELLSQKPRLEPMDHELLDLLGEHAATAISAAYLFGKASDGSTQLPWSRLARELAQAAP